MSGVNYDVLDAATGEALLMVRHLWPEEPVQCCMCDKPTHSRMCVPYYCGATRTGKSEGGYSTAYKTCYSRWEKWDDAGAEYDSWLEQLRSATLPQGGDSAIRAAQAAEGAK